MSGQAGARWIARELSELADERAASVILTQEKGGDPANQSAALYPLLWRLDLPSIEALAEVCGQSVGEFVAGHGGCQ